ncbi:hypothetical protein P691DRAFT_775777 [Macrolepiota fuliginosa MF-IS2]|uniref:Transmembrane protein n=1 Tax=Macrolepiota fuliginosa MF-IS2 TaxID=1400762 RepID=A0A9P5XE86_9AGAR|nr:hypothetical protein P691DRAFT_775777 [Macrolepiota fuliginosa MF-IS2]
MGPVLAGFPQIWTTGSWSIDGGDPTQFHIQRLPNTDNATLYNQIYFETPKIQQGSHTLNVTFLGSSITSPLSLDFLYVKNGTFPVNTTQTPGPNTQLRTGFSQPPLGAILGGVLGGLALLLLTLVGACLYRRRRLGGGIITTRGAEHRPTPFNPYDDQHPPSPSPNNVMAQVNRRQFYTLSRPFKATRSPATPTSERHRPGMGGRKQWRVDGQLRDNIPPAPVHVRIGGNVSSFWQQIVPTANGGIEPIYVDSGIRLGQQTIDAPPPGYTPD